MWTGVSWPRSGDKRRAGAVDEPDGRQEGGRSAIRLFVRAALDAGVPVVLDAAQAHYLRNVMRQAPGDRVRLFNGARRGVGGHDRDPRSPPCRHPHRGPARRAAAGAGLAAPCSRRSRPSAPASRSRRRPSWAWAPSTRCSPGAAGPGASTPRGSRRVRSRRPSSAAGWTCRRSSPPALSQTHSPPGRPNAGCWSAIRRPSAPPQTRSPPAAVRPGRS